MSSQEIEKILERYFHGESSLSEERSLKAFFKKEDLPAHLADLREQFLVFEQEREEVLPDDFDDNLFKAIEKEEKSKKASKRAVIYYVGSVAATILIILTIFIRFDPLARNTQTMQAEEAFAEASQVLYFVSGKFMQGTNKLGTVGQFNDNVSKLENVKKFDDGVEKASTVSRFKQITDLFTNPAP